MIDQIRSSDTSDHLISHQIDHFDAGGRHRKATGAQVHRLHVPARGALPGAATEAVAWLQHQLPDHQQAHRADVQAQIGRLHHTVHGRYR